MSKFTQEDLTTAHRYFSAACFNTVWDYMDKKTRTPKETEEMIHTCHASFWHWLQREDRTAKEMSIGYWQLSRVYVLANLPDPARQYAAQCLEYAEAAGFPFYIGYAYEALSRAEAMERNTLLAEQYLQAARNAAEEIEKDEEKKMLLRDLETIP